MAAPPTPLSHQDLVLRRLAQERKQEADEQFAVWGFLWTLFAFKIATVIVIFFAASRSGESLTMILATTWYWLVIPVFAIGGPMLIRWRMIQARRKREMLMRSEWDVPTPLNIRDIHVLHDPPIEDSSSHR